MVSFRPKLQHSRPALAVVSVALALAVMLAFFVAGCGKQNDRGARANFATSPDEIRRSSDAMLRNALLLLVNQRDDESAQHRLSRAEKQSVENLVRGNLNQWLQQSGFAQTLAVSDSIAHVLAGLVQQGALPPAMIEPVGLKYFTPADARHIDDCLLLSEIVAHAKGDHPDDLSRAQSVFDWVVRNIELVEAGDDEHASLQQYAGPTLRNPLLIGKGTLMERSWLFVLLLRQLKLQACFIGPETPQRGFEPRWVGVLIREELYVFNARLGLPLPGTGGQGVATLSELAADPREVLERWPSGEAGEALLSERELQGIVLRFEASPVCWAPRMKLLEEKLAGHVAPVVLYEELGAPEGFARAPAKPEAESESLPGRLRRAAGPLRRPFFAAAPVGAIHVPTMLLAQAVVPAQRKGARPPIVEPFDFGNAFLGRARKLQWQGRWDGAVERYMKVLSVHAEMISDTDRYEPRDLFFGQLAHEMATYWVGVCMYERGRYQLAVETWLRPFLKRYPESRWRQGARYMLARSLEAWAEQMTPDDPQRVPIVDEAAALYRAATSPQKIGERIRADLLEARVR